MLHGLFARDRPEIFTVFDIKQESKRVLLCFNQNMCSVYSSWHTILVSMRVFITFGNAYIVEA